MFLSDAHILSYRMWVWLKKKLNLQITKTSLNEYKALAPWEIIEHFGTISGLGSGNPPIFSVM